MPSIIKTFFAKQAILYLLALSAFASSAIAQVKTESPEQTAPKATTKKKPEDTNSPKYQKANIAAPKLASGSPTVTDKGFVKRHALLNERIKKGNVNLLFIGDSITHFWERPEGKEIWEKYYGKRNAVNLGISGDQTQHVIWRLQNGNLDGSIKPKTAVIMIGTNNLDRTYTPEEIAAGIEEIVKTIRTKLPETKILLLGIFPRGHEPGDVNDKTTHEKLPKVNAIIKKFDDGKNVFYLDIGSQFLGKDDVPNADVMPDTVHLSKKGFQIWANAIEGTLVELLGEKPTK